HRQARLDSIFRVAPTGIGVVADRILVEVNDRICEMTGYAREELVGQSSLILYPTLEDYDYVGTEKYRQISEKGTGTVETRWLRKDGAIIDIILSSTPLDPLDLPAGVTFTALDITERKRAEEALRSSEEKYRVLIQQIYAAVVVHGADTQILTCNQQAQELLGLTEDQLLGKQAIDPDWKFFREDGTTMPLEEYPVMRVLATRKPFWNTVTGVHRPNMEEDVWVLVNAAPVLDEKDELLQIVVTFVDITERKKIEEDLQKTNQMLQAIIDASPLAILTLDHDLRVTSWSPAAERIFGWSRKEALGRYNPIVPEEKWAEFKALVSMVFSGTGYSHSEVERKTKDGRTIHVNVSTEPLRDASGNVVGALGVIQDITERKRIEEEKRRLEVQLAQAQ
ncbi:PAS domain S-box protein, partial [bacterium]|nr:PAS domain S-box protein [bacterium]